ncbi:MAG: hypothetical protein ABR511_06370 [Acidimicrobiales bacterium]
MADRPPTWGPLTAGEWIVVVSGVLVVLDLVLLPWHRVSIGLGSLPGVHVDRKAIESPDAGWAVAAMLLTIAVVAQVVLSHVAGDRLPRLPDTWGPVAPGRLAMIGAVLVLALLVLKLLANTNFLGYGSWLGVILAGAAAYGGVAVERERRRPPAGPDPPRAPGTDGAGGQPPPAGTAEP